MEIYLIRHTTPKVEKGFCYGFLDLELAASSEEELDLVSEKMIEKLYAAYERSEKPMPIMLHTSSLQRCTILAKRLKTDLENYFLPKVKKNKALKEMNFGDWEGKKWDDLGEKPEFRKWMENFVTKRIPNGESFIALHERVTNYFEEVILKEEKEIVLVVCHAGVIRSILCHTLEIPLKKAFSMSADYGSISKIKAFESHLQVEFLNH